MREITVRPETPADAAAIEAVTMQRLRTGKAAGCLLVDDPAFKTTG